MPMHVDAIGITSGDVRSVMMAQQKLRIGLAQHDINMPILDGTVKPEGFDLEMISGTDDGAIHQLLRDDEVDVCEYGFAALLQDKANDLPFDAIPVFPNRKFRLSYIYVNAAAGLTTAKDLEGKRVGIPGWANSCNVWARGALQHYYGVDLTKVQWFARRSGSEKLPPGISLEVLERGKDLNDLLATGQLDAVIEPNVLPAIQEGDARVRRLFPDFKAEEQTYFQKTGIFPISHMLTFSRAYTEKNPDAPIALLKAFREARDEAYRRIEEQQVISISWTGALLNEQRALMGENCWPYNVADNRHSLEAMTQYAYEHGMTPHQVPYESLFHAAAAAYPGA
jgi:4,5-dihydroxyphthalate decarboxylase